MSFFVTDLEKEKYLDKLNFVKDALVQIEKYEKRLESDNNLEDKSGDL